MDSYIREIVTLQVGHYSNFIGSHWLNLQEANFVFDESIPTDINHDYLFQEGKLSSNEQSYTPRLLIIDANGSLRSLPKVGTLYEPSYNTAATSQALWSGKVDLINHTPEDKNEFLQDLEKADLQHLQNLDEDKDICSDESCVAQNFQTEKKVYDLSNKVNVWSDFLRPHLHHKTIYLFNEVCHRDITSFNSQDQGESSLGWCYQEGVEAMKREGSYDEITDRIRLLSESCGSLQGFQLLCDDYDGMGGVGAMIAEHIADDYCAKDLFSFVSHPPYYKPRMAPEISVHLTNLIQCYTELAKHSSILLPLNLRPNVSKLSSEDGRWPYLTYKESCPYETSSIFGSFLDTISVHWRTKSNPVPMSYIANILSPLQRKVIGGSFSFPIGLEENTPLNDWLTENEDLELKKKLNFNSVGGGCNFGTPKTAEVHAIRGIPFTLLEGSHNPKRMKYENASQLLEHHLNRDDDKLKKRVFRVVSGVRDPLHTTAPFPQIFTNLNNKGYVKKVFDNTRNIVESVPSVASFHQGDGIGLYLDSMASDGQKINVSKLPELFTGKLEKEVWNTALEDFLALVNAYDIKCDNDSDSD